MGRKGLQIRGKGAKRGVMRMTRRDYNKWNNTVVVVPIFSLDATKNVTLSVGNLVERWDDERSNGLFVEQATGGNQPETGYLINGLNAIRFESKFMIQSGNSFPTDWSLFVIEKGLQASGNDSHIVGTDGNPTDGSLFCGFNTDTSSKFSLRGTSGINSIIPDYITRDVSLWEYRIVDGVKSTYRNGVLLDTVSSDVVDITGNFMVGSGATTGFRVTDSLIGEVRLYDGSADRVKITNELMTKWSV